MSRRVFSLSVVGACLLLADACNEAMKSASKGADASNGDATPKDAMAHGDADSAGDATGDASSVDSGTDDATQDANDSGPTSDGNTDAAPNDAAPNDAAPPDSSVADAPNDAAPSDAAPPDSSVADATSDAANTDATSDAGNADAANEADAISGCPGLPAAVSTGSPSTAFAVGTVTHVPGAGVYVGRDSGGLYALSDTCTYAVCTVQILSGLLYCPCHGDRFDFNGQIISGPAYIPLPHYAVCIDGNGIVFVDPTVPVSPSARTPG